MSPAEFSKLVKATLARAQHGAFETVRPLSVTEQVANVVKEMILDGSLAPGEHVVEEALAIRCGTSRAPVREALRMLDKEGFVKISPRRGVFVHLPGAEEVANLYEVRAELFALATWKATTRVTDELNELARQGLEIMKELSEKPDSSVSDFVRVRDSLSEIILESAENPKLAEVSYVLAAQAVQHAWVFAQPGKRADSLIRWTMLFEAIFERDAEKAASRARSMSLEMKNELILLMEERFKSLSSASKSENIGKRTSRFG